MPTGVRLSRQEGRAAISLGRMVDRLHQIRYILICRIKVKEAW